jgi:hypothetical protein
MIESLRHGAWATPARVKSYLLMLAAANLIFLALAICRAHGWVLPQEAHLSTEFSSFYAAGRLADAGQAMAVYAPSGPGFIPSFQVPLAHKAMEIALAHDPQALYFSFYYPPVFLLVCAAIAALPFSLAYLVWVLGSAGFLAGALKNLAGGWGKVWPALAFTSVIENAGVGENAFWSAGLVASGLAVLEKRPMLAGLCFGALCFKPHYLLPVGLFLLIGGQGRALLSMGAGAAAFCTAAGLVFGWPIWVLYFTVTVPHAAWAFAHHAMAYDIQITPGSAVRLLGGGPALAQVVGTAGMAFAAWVMWGTRKAGADIRAAVLCASFPLLAEVMLHYDLCIPGLAVVFLLRAAAVTGYFAWEKTVLAALFVLPLITVVLRTDLHLPVDSLVPLAFLALMARRKTAPPM